MKSKPSAALIALSIIGAYAALAGSTAARAALITFTLSDVVFTGVGCSPQTPCGTATGSFTFSSDTGLVTDVNILTDRGGIAVTTAARTQTPTQRTLLFLPGQG